MSERGDCFDELFELTNRFVSNEEKAFDRLMSFAAGDSPPMDEHGNYIDDSAKLDRQRKNDGHRLSDCIVKCFDYEKAYGGGTELLDALIVLEKAVSSLNEWAAEVDLRFFESEWEGAMRGGGWDDGKAKLKATIKSVDQSLDKVLVLRILARKKACAASTGEPNLVASDCPSHRSEDARENLEPPVEQDGPFGLNGFRWGMLPEREGLTSKPFGLLSVLWNAKDRTATFDDLAEHVWDDTTRDGHSLRNDSRLSSARRAVNAFMEAGALAK